MSSKPSTKKALEEAREELKHADMGKFDRACARCLKSPRKRRNLSAKNKMTTISQICSEPSDIQGIQLQCRECGSTISFALNSWKPRSLTCPNCSVTLVQDKSDDWLALDGPKQALKTLVPNDTRKFLLRFQFNQS
jgi:hypothetical protein